MNGLKCLHLARLSDCKDVCSTYLRHDIGEVPANDSKRLSVDGKVVRGFLL